MLQNGSLEASWGYLADRGLKCFKTFSGGLLGILCGLGLEMLKNSHLEAFWGYFAGLGPQMLQNRLLEASWGLVVQSL
jgi:hypothetical protein